jgi:hypothetical protein
MGASPEYVNSLGLVLLLNNSKFLPFNILEDR